MTYTERARRIVKLAAEMGGLDGDEYTRSWLLHDGHGTWEKEAIRLLEIAAPRVTTETEADVDYQCATYIRIQALTAQINYQERKKT